MNRGHLVMPHGMESMRPPGHMTREELERHLDMKQSSKSQFMSIESAPHSLPEDIFSNESSNHDRSVWNLCCNKRFSNNVIGLFII